MQGGVGHPCPAPARAGVPNVNRPIPPAGKHISRLVSSLDVKVVYADLDGTLVGPGGSLFTHPTGPTVEPSAALAALTAAGVDLVLVSGRTRDQLREIARTVGAAGYVAELGAGIVRREGQAETALSNTGAFRGRGTAYDAIQRSGAGGALLEAYPGRLEPHAPWAHVSRECSVLLRGQVDVREVTALLLEGGYDWLAMEDNGIIHGGRQRFPELAVEEVHVYHLLPAGVSKRSAVAMDVERRGLAAANCIAVGDSRSDAGMAPEVGAVFLVANGAPAVRGLDLPTNVYLTDRSYGLGFAEAVMPFASDSPSGEWHGHRYSPGSR